MQGSRRNGAGVASSVSIRTELREPIGGVETALRRGVLGSLPR